MKSSTNATIERREVHAKRMTTGAPGSASEYWKAARVSATAGASFGLVIALLFQWVEGSPWHPILFLGVCAAAAGIVAGLSAIAATYLDGRLLVWGVEIPWVRAALSFLFVAVITFSLPLLSLPLLGIEVVDSTVRQYSLWGWILGLSFGAVFQLLNFRSETMLQQMQLLEMENRHLADLASREQLIREAARNLAVTEERNRMARELHDSISQGVHGIVYSLRSLRPLFEENPQGQAILSHLEETAATTLKELRHLVTELSPSPLEEHGLKEALRLHCDLFAGRQQVAMDCELSYDGELQPDQEAAIYRIVQEALTNIQRHAGATHVGVSLRPGEGSCDDFGGPGGEAHGRTYILTVRDNGCGFDADAKHVGHGLTNMATRARQCGGRLHIESRAGNGTTIVAELPVVSVARPEFP